MGKNKKGGIEGLPLHLLIVIVIASLGLSMMVGWMNNIEEPTTISRVEAYATPVEGDYGKDFNITIVVYDNKGNPVEGAAVALTGLGVTVNKPSTTSGFFEDLLELLGMGGSNNTTTTAPTTPPSTTPTTTPSTTPTTTPSTTPTSAPSVSLNNGADSYGGVPFANTGSDGTVSFLVYLTGLRDYGYLNIEVSKTGYGTYKDRIPVAI